jgi:hypothetical protein
VGPRGQGDVHNPAGEHYTYRVCKVESEGRPTAYFAKLLAGADNDSDEFYIYLGMIDPMGGGVRLTRASRLTHESTAVKVLGWALKKVWGGVAVPQGYGINGDGNCARCGRTLTAPDGVAPEGFRYGFGPVCWNKIQNGQ